ncbi:MAG: MATE family efflux transporter [Acidobacteriota bacterium]
MSTTAPSPTPTISPAWRLEVRDLLRLAGPLVGGQLALMGLNFTDTVMAGRIDAIALAAVAIGNSVWSAVNLFVMGVLMAVPPSIAQLDGAGRRPAVAPFARQSLWLAAGLIVVAVMAVTQIRPLLVAVGVQAEIIPTVVAYLRAMAWGIPAWGFYLTLRFVSEGLGATRPTLYFALVGLAVNIPANYALMFGKLGLPAIGAEGCGYATACVWWVQVISILIYLARHPRYDDLGLFALFEGPRRQELGDLLRVGLPIGIAIFVEASLFATVALLLGSLGTKIVAAHQVALNFVAITFMIPVGLSMAISVRVGNAVGRRDPPGIRRAAIVGVAVVMAVQVFSATCMLLFPEPIARIYTGDTEIVVIAVQLLFLAAVFQLSDGLQVSASGALRGLKDTRVPMLLTLVAYWLCGLPLGHALAFRWQLEARGMWIGLIAGLTLAALLLTVRLRRVLPAAEVESS